jgi:hypothetical protein
MTCKETTLPDVTVVLTCYAAAWSEKDGLHAAACCRAWLTAIATATAPTLAWRTLTSLRSTELYSDIAF